jgi:hypothetical protein
VVVEESKMPPEPQAISVVFAAIGKEMFIACPAVPAEVTFILK